MYTYQQMIAMPIGKTLPVVEMAASAMAQRLDEPSEVAAILQHIGCKQHYSVLIVEYTPEWRLASVWGIASPAPWLWATAEKLY